MRRCEPRRPTTPDLLVIDVGLPDADGRDLCQALRARGVDAPVLFLTARDAVTDLLSGFEAGGDDYVTKPFEFAELVARLRALRAALGLRRRGRRSATCASIRSAHEVAGPARHRGADADRVPAARARSSARPGRGGAPPRARRAPPGPTGRSSTTTRSTSTSRGCGASCGAVECDDRDRHRARGRIPAVSRTALAAQAPHPAGHDRGRGRSSPGRPSPSTSLLRSSLDADANRLLASQRPDGRSRRSRFDARRAAGDRGRRHAAHRTRRRGCSPAAAALERTPSDPAVGRLADSLAGTDGRIAEDAGDRHAALFDGDRPRRRRRPGRSSAASRWSRTSAPRARALVGSVILAAFLLARDRRSGRAASSAAPCSPVARDDSRGGAVERDRPRSPLQRRPAPRRADRPRSDLRRDAGPAGREPPPRAAVHGRGLARAADAARGDRHRGGARPATRARPTTTTGAALAGIAERARELQRIVETLLADRPRGGRRPRATLRPRRGRAAGARRRIAARRSNRRGLELRADGRRRRRVASRAEQAVVERILAPLVENACRPRCVPRLGDDRAARRGAADRRRRRRPRRRGRPSASGSSSPDTAGRWRATAARALGWRSRGGWRGRSGARSLRAPEMPPGEASSPAYRRR